MKSSDTFVQVVNSASLCVFAATGAGKAAMMETLLGELPPGQTPLPARYRSYDKNPGEKSPPRETSID